METCRTKQRYELEREREVNREQRTVMHLTIRLTTPVLMSVGRIFRLVTSNCQNRSVPLEWKQGRFSSRGEKRRLYLPALKNWNSSSFDAAKQKVMPALLCWAGLPQTGSLVSMFQTTIAPSSCPPNEMRKRSDAVNTRSSIFTLCKTRRA